MWQTDIGYPAPPPWKAHKARTVYAYAGTDDGRDTDFWFGHFKQYYTMNNSFREVETKVFEDLKCNTCKWKIFHLVKCIGLISLLANAPKTMKVLNSVITK